MIHLGPDLKYLGYHITEMNHLGQQGVYLGYHYHHLGHAQNRPVVPLTEMIWPKIEMNSSRFSPKPT